MRKAGGIESAYRASQPNRVDGEGATIQLLELELELMNNLWPQSFYRELNGFGGYVDEQRTFTQPIAVTSRRITPSDFAMLFCHCKG